MIQRTTSIDPNRIGKEYGRVRKETEKREKERKREGRRILFEGKMIFEGNTVNA